MNIFLTGYRGVGKTTVARHLARLTGRDWVDADDEIVRADGRPIAQIFAEDGEAVFRDIEAQVVADLAVRSDTVVSLGGGAILREESRRIIRDAGVVIWLQADAETIDRRINGNAETAGKRPDLTDKGGLEEIKELLAVRNPLYQEVATLTVSGIGRTPQAIAKELAAMLRNRQ